MELLKDYDVTILYHPDKANMVADALRKKFESMGSLAYLEVTRRLLPREVRTLANNLMGLELSNLSRVLARVEARSSFLDQTKTDSLRMLS